MTGGNRVGGLKKLINFKGADGPARSGRSDHLVSQNSNSREISKIRHATSDSITCVIGGFIIHLLLRHLVQYTTGSERYVRAVVCAGSCMHHVHPISLILS